MEDSRSKSNVSSGAVGRGPTKEEVPVGGINNNVGAGVEMKIDSSRDGGVKQTVGINEETKRLLMLRSTQSAIFHFPVNGMDYANRMDAALNTLINIKYSEVLVDRLNIGVSDPGDIRGIGFGSDISEGLLQFFPVLMAILVNILHTDAQYKCEEEGREVGVDDIIKVFEACLAAYHRTRPNTIQPSVLRKGLVEKQETITAMDKEFVINNVLAVLNGHNNINRIAENIFNTKQVSADIDPAMEIPGSHELTLYLLKGLDINSEAGLTNKVIMSYPEIFGALQVACLSLDILDEEQNEASILNEMIVPCPGTCAYAELSELPCGVSGVGPDPIFIFNRMATCGGTYVTANNL